MFMHRVSRVRSSAGVKMIGNFSSPLTFCGSVWVHVWAAVSKGTVSSVPAWFRVDSGMNLIKQMEIVTGRRCVWLFSSVV